MTLTIEEFFEYHDDCLPDNASSMAISFFYGNAEEGVQLCRDEIDRLKLLPAELSQSPWPENIWTMTEDSYCATVPDPDTRTAISGYLMRKGWELAVEKMKELAQQEAKE